MTMRRPGGMTLISEINESRVLDAVRREGEATRGRVAELTGLSAPAVTTITTRLLAAGVLRETDLLPSTGGRPARSLALAADGKLAIGIELRRESASVTLVNAVGEVLEHHQPTWRGSEVGAALTALDATVGGMVGDERILGIGIAVSGIVDHDTGIVEHSGVLHWDSVPLARIASARWALPVTVDNLANSLAAGMTLVPSDSSSEGENLLIVNVDRSLGMSMILGGRPHRGSTGRAGGLAHMRSIAAGDASCHCGRTGCLDTVAGRWGIEQRHLDATADSLHELAGRALGQALADCVTLLDPDRIVLTHAGLLDSGPYRHGLGSGYGSTDPGLVFIPMAPDSWSRGAACRILSALFDHEQRAALTPLTGTLTTDRSA